MDDNDIYFEDDDKVCEHCDGEGYLMICIDSVCIGQGHCMHGDGEIICPFCHGEGFL